jgi:hypothetical protein
MLMKVKVRDQNERHVGSIAYSLYNSQLLTGKEVSELVEYIPNDTSYNS